MYRIVKKEALKPTVTLYEIEAPMVAKMTWVSARSTTVSGKPPSSNGCPWPGSWPRRCCVSRKLRGGG